MKKIKTIYPVILLTLLLLVSCKSKKNMVATLPRPVLNSDSIYPDTANAIAGLFSPDHSQLKELNVSKNKKQNTKEKTSTDTHESSDLVLRGTKITSSSVDVSSVYTGVDRVVKYDFTHRDVPEAFEGFRIAFISDLHYKSLLKEKGLSYEEIVLGKDATVTSVRAITGKTAVPQVFIGGKHIGGSDELAAYLK